MDAEVSQEQRETVRGEWEGATGERGTGKKRRENKELREEVEILKKSASYYVWDNVPKERGKRGELTDGRSVTVKLINS